MQFLTPDLASEWLLTDEHRAYDLFHADRCGGNGTDRPCSYSPMLRLGDLTCQAYLNLMYGEDSDEEDAA